MDPPVRFAGRAGRAGFAGHAGYGGYGGHASHASHANHDGHDGPRSVFSIFYIFDIFRLQDHVACLPEQGGPEANIFKNDCAAYQFLATKMLKHDIFYDKNVASRNCKNHVFPCLRSAIRAGTPLRHCCTATAAFMADR
jgi:hypothetical protein